MQSQRSLGLILKRLQASLNIGKEEEKPRVESRRQKRTPKAPVKPGKGKKGAKEEDAGPSAEQLEAEAAAKDEEEKQRAKEEAIRNQKPKDYDEEEIAKIELYNREW